jgi:flagellar basal-body rod protein FlgG
MRGQQTQIDTIAQNVANLNTVGYRRSVVSFAEVAAAVGASAPVTDSTQISAAADSARTLGAGAVPTISLSLAGGALKQTGDPLNIAIDGQGFLEVMRADGTPAFTRAGQLRVNADGLLAFADGSPLASRIAIPSDVQNLQIAANGQVSALVGSDTDATELGRIELVGFANASGLKSVGDNLYVATTQSGDPQVGAPGESSLGMLKQGFVENSNVQMSDELVNLMLAQRSFELNSKIIQAADQMLGITNGLYR